MHYVVAYDISSDRRRQKVLNLLKNYGMPVQYSVVECELDASRFEALKRDVLPLLNRRTDRINVYRLCEKCYFRSEHHGASLPSLRAIGLGTL